MNVRRWRLNTSRVQECCTHSIAATRHAVGTMHRIHCRMSMRSSSISRITPENVFRDPMPESYPCEIGKPTEIHGFSWKHDETYLISIENILKIMDCHGFPDFQPRRGHLASGSRVLSESSDNR